MTMQSSSLLPALLELPGGNDGTRQSFREIMTGLVSTDRAMYAAEFASAVSFGMWPIFDDINVDDSLAESYATRWPDMATDHSLHEKWQMLVESGQGTGESEWFYSGLKGQLAEFKVPDLLKQDGFTNIDFPRNEQGEINPTNEGHDISAIAPDGQEVLIQVKTGESLSSSDFRNLMVENPDINIWAIGTEYHDKAVRAAESVPDMVDRIIMEIGPDHEVVDGITDGLTTLSANMGIDVPDGIVHIVPFAGAIFAGARLVYSVIKTEGEFRAVDRTAKNKIQVVQSLTLMSRMGINTVLSIAGGKGGALGGTVAGTLAGTVVPGVGNAVGGTVGGIGGGIVGALVGWRMGRFLNQHLQPHMLDLALNITGLGHDDLFYYKNKVRIDEVAFSIRQTAGQLE